MTASDRTASAIIEQAEQRFFLSPLPSPFPFVPSPSPPPPFFFLFSSLFSSFYSPFPPFLSPSPSLPQPRSPPLPKKKFTWGPIKNGWDGRYVFLDWLLNVTNSAQENERSDYFGDGYLFLCYFYFRLLVEVSQGGGRKRGKEEKGLLLSPLPKFMTFSLYKPQVYNLRRRVWCRFNSNISILIFFFNFFNRDNGMI